MDNAIIRAVNAAMAGEPLQTTGPAINGHVGEVPFFAWPLAPINVQLEEGNIAEFVLHPPRDGLDLEVEVLHKPPAVIPEGYYCQLRYRPLAEGEEPPRPSLHVSRPREHNVGRGAPSRPPPVQQTTADQELWEWQNTYGSGPVQSNQAAFSNLQEHMADVLRSQFGIMPKRGVMTNSKPYPEAMDRMPAPPKFKIPDFSKFSGNDNTTTFEHISRHLAQLGFAASADFMRIRFFSLSLTGLIFGWYNTLPPGSITTWKQLEEQFHNHFYSGSNETTLTDLTAICQRQGESMGQYIRRFREIRNKCYAINLPEKSLAELAYGGLLKPIKTIYGPTDFESIGHLVSKVSAYEHMHLESFQDKQKWGVFMTDPRDDDSSDNPKVALVQWAKTNQPFSCPWVKPLDAKIGYDFDTAKTEVIFDALLKEKFLVLTPDHPRPSPEEIQGKKYCKWHGTFDSHHTVDCRSLRQHIQSAIEQGRLAFSHSPMKIDKAPFLSVNIVSIASAPGQPRESVHVSGHGDFALRIQDAINNGRLQRRAKARLTPGMTCHWSLGLKHILRPDRFQFWGARGALCASPSVKGEPTPA